ncbi:hypothetical protein CFD26_103904 [Aspergillus turcosus]|uniref:Uncharacterized protein n=1 Tax=Aspergillus turcosus TaxID=1245748 RepID=A0A421D105_9EURO|nr:hypothetical protein CFD26_103904 [Aspergillus turcosus]
MASILKSILNYFLPHSDTSSPHKHLAKYKANLHFLDLDSEVYKTQKPYYSNLPFTLAGAPNSNVQSISHEVLVADIRGHEHEFSLDRNGFELVEYHTRFNDWNDGQRVVREVYPTIVKFLQNHLGDGVHVLVFDHTLRRSDKLSAEQALSDASFAPPSKVAHVDQTYEATTEQIKLDFGHQGDAILRGRFRIINLWHPLKHPVRQHPLALCDYRTARNDAMPCDLVYPHTTTEITIFRYSSGQRWYFIDNQTPKEMWIFKIMDSESRKDGAIAESSSPQEQIIIFNFFASRLYSSKVLTPKTLNLFMSLFLEIPFELRALMIRHVLYTPLSPPVTPLQSDAIQYNDLRYKAWGGSGSKAYYNKQQSMASSSSCLSLLLTNHQISTETRVVLGRRKVDYILDISVKDDLTLFLTWLSVPRLTTHISTLYANVRLFGHIIEKRAVRSQFGDGGRLGFHWSFYAALERFLRYGPVGEKRRKEEDESSEYRRPTQEFEDRGMLIDTLVLDFQSAELELAFPPEDVTYKHWWGRHWGRDWRDQSEISETLSSYTTRPEWLCEYLRVWIGGLLHMGYHTSAFGKPIYEHIGTIRMLVDGQLHYEFDLAACLARLRFTDPGILTNDRESGLWKWKKETLLRREAQGFPVMKEPSDDELGRREIEQ